MKGFADQDTIRFDAAGSEMATITANGLALPNGARIDEFSTDGTLAGNSDISVPTERAVKTYVDQLTFDEIKDADGNTRIQVEESVNENITWLSTKVRSPMPCSCSCLSPTRSQRRRRDDCTVRTRIWHSDWKPRCLIRCVSAALLSFMDKQETLFDSTRMALSG